jgi:hypothetical protein
MSIEAMKQALEALENLQGLCTDSEDGTVKTITVWSRDVIDVLRKALAQSEQTIPSDHPNSHQPKWVAFRNKQTGEFCTGGFLRGQLWQWTPLYDHPYELVCVCGAAWEGDTMVETPSKRTWVGLTEEEIADVANGCRWSDTYHADFANAIEAKLREKNGC